MKTKRRVLIEVATVPMHRDRGFVITAKARCQKSTDRGYLYLMPLPYVGIARGV
jgi:hypothetical protein